MPWRGEDRQGLLFPTLAAISHQSGYGPASARSGLYVEGEFDAAWKEVAGEEAKWKAEAEAEVLRRRRAEMHFARKFDSLQKALKEARSAFACDEHRVSAAIGIFEARRKDSAWVRQFQGRLEAEMLAQDFYNYEGTCRAQLIMESRRGA